MSNTPKDKCFNDVTDRCRYMAQVAKSEVMRYSLTAAVNEIDRLRMRVSELEGITAFDSALQELEARGKVIDEQRRIIEALNAIIGREGSTTLENIRGAE